MAESRSLVARLLDTPDLATIVPRLQPDVLHRVVQVCGLEDCAELVALATPDQLGRVLDVDLWRAPTPGADETFDADRFALWIEVLMQAGVHVAAEKLIGLDVDLVIAGCARHVRVFDHAAVASYQTLDGTDVPGRATDGEPVAEIGGYVIEAKRPAAFDTIIELLAHLAAEQPTFFQRVMRGCVALSNGAREQDGFHDLLDDAGQSAFDLAAEREARREREGYVAAAQARAFLHGARTIDVTGGRPRRDPIAFASSHAVSSAAQEDRDDDVSADDGDARRVVEGGPDEPAAAAIVAEMLREAGVIGVEPPRALLGAGDDSAVRLAHVHAHVSAHPDAAESLAFLANALAAGCSVQGRPLTPRDASEVAAATCNLGLENWPAAWADPDLITAFQLGWAMLHRDVAAYAAGQLLRALDQMRCADRDIQLRLDRLRRDLSTAIRDGVPWRARPAMDALLMIDASAWAALLALVDECPVVHAVVSAPHRCRRINPDDFTVIAQNSDIRAVRAFLASLPALLTT